jgi:hypothetical protein
LSAPVLTANAEDPKALLLFDVMLVPRAFIPKAALFVPVVLASRAKAPYAELLAAVLTNKALAPKALLFVAVVLASRADTPKAEFPAPELSLAALTPKEVLVADNKPARILFLLKTTSRSSEVPMKIVGSFPTKTHLVVAVLKKYKPGKTSSLLFKTDVAMLKTMVPFAGAKPVTGLTTGAAVALLVKETRGTKIPLVVEVMSSAPAGAVVPIPTCAKDDAAQAKKEIKIILFMIVKYINRK